GSGELFAFASMRSQFELRIGGRMVVLDRLVAREPEDVAALSRLWGGQRHLAMVAAYAPNLPPSVVEQVQETCTSLVRSSEAGATMVDGVVVARILAERVWQAHEAIYRIWETVRPVIGGKPARPIRKP
ncbi:MAG TPA: urease accessory protein UreD, partial [Gemmatimonadaceae bacterium]